MFYIIHKAQNQDANPKTASAFEIVVDKGFDLFKQCESLFNIYQEHSSQLRNGD